MSSANTQVDRYLLEGCGRCPLGNTPACKVNSWRDELSALRRIVLASGLKEEVKWGVPCYTTGNKNVLVISALKDCCTISFFKGALIQDAKGLLSKPGEHTQSGRIIRFTNVREIKEMEADLRAYIAEAIEIERSGLKVQFEQNPEPMPDELTQKLNEDPALRIAFETLTPGRQRGYILHFTAPKQSKTREARIEKCTPQILAGKGLHDDRQ